MTEIPVDIDLVLRLANTFRAGILASDQTELGISFQMFPRGSCGDASLLLARYLREQGAGSFEYVLGFRGEGHDRGSHAWLERGGVVVDITADQFDDAPSPVVVAKKSPFHDTFEREFGHSADYRQYSMNIYPTLDMAYATVLSNCPTVNECAD